MQTSGGDTMLVPEAHLEAAAPSRLSGPGDAVRHTTRTPSTWTMQLGRTPLKQDLPPICEPAVRTIAMPADTNPAGDIFGGWLLWQMDLAAGNAAARHARGRCATVAIDEIAFLQPVKVGDEVTVYAELVSTGRTSMRVCVTAWRRRRDAEEVHKVTGAIFTFVALDLDGRPREIAPMVR